MYQADLMRSGCIVSHLLQSFWSLQARPSPGTRRWRPRWPRACRWRRRWPASPSTPLWSRTPSAAGRSPAGRLERVRGKLKRPDQHEQLIGNVRGNWYSRHKLTCHSIFNGKSRGSPNQWKSHTEHLKIFAHFRVELFINR